jgi:hypothetical protein
MVLAHRGVDHVPDFLVTREDGAFLMDVGSSSSPHPVDWCREAAERQGFRYERHALEPALRCRLENARDLMAYALSPIPLRERLILLACLDEYRTLPLAACMQVIRDGRDPIGTIAAMALHRFIDIDLDTARIGPETRVSRFHD